MTRIWRTPMHRQEPAAAAIRRIPIAEMPVLHWRALPRDWLGRKAQCVGSAPVAEMPAEWWKMPAEPAPAEDA